MEPYSRNSVNHSVEREEESAYDAADAVRIAGRKTNEIAAILGYDARSAMIHRDDLVVRAAKRAVKE